MPPEVEDELHNRPPVHFPSTRVPRSAVATAQAAEEETPRRVSFKPLGHSITLRRLVKEMNVLSGLDYFVMGCIGYSL